MTASQPGVTVGGVSAHAPTGAERLCKAAVDNDISVCFANPGTSEMHFVAALDSVSGLRAVLGLHETVCSGAADGYGRMARKPALTLLHLGPGLANGLANLHNARRAGTPLINLIGDMATWHGPADPLLAMDIQALAGTVSKTVRVVQAGDDLAASMAGACADVAHANSAGGSRVATLIVPHDISWERKAGGPAGANAGSSRAAGSSIAGLSSSGSSSNGAGLVGSTAGTAGSTAGSVAGAAAALGEASPAVVQFVRECAAALKACPRGKAALLLGGRATLTDGDALLNAGRIASATGAALLCENAFARLDRGAGLPDIQRLPYFPQEAAAALSSYQMLVLVDVRRPVANFGYEGGPSHLISLEDEAVWELDAGMLDVPAALRMLCAELGAQGITPGVNCRGRFCSAGCPPLPKGRLTAASLCQALAALQPPGCILVDESLTSGNAYWEASRGCPPFSHLTLTGGAIGCGPPMALGAAIACPDRTVINFQADGSCLYSLQALWSQAREGAHVVTIVCSNRTYSILKVELAKQKITPSNGKAGRALTELNNPTIDWVALAQGFGVPGSRATSCEELAAQLAAALERQGPSLIEAVL